MANTQEVTTQNLKNQLDTKRKQTSKLNSK